MKYAFIFGSNAFITSQGVIHYIENGETKEFLRIISTVKHYAGAADSALKIAAEITDGHGMKLQIGDWVIGDLGFNLEQTADRIKVLKPDGNIIIDVHELGDDAVQHLSHHITAELDRYATIVVIRLNGDFMAGDCHIVVDNEKLFVDGNSYAESVHVEHQGGLVFTKEGVTY